MSLVESKAKAVEASVRCYELVQDPIDHGERRCKRNHVIELPAWATWRRTRMRVCMQHFLAARSEARKRMTALETRLVLHEKNR